MSAEGIERGEKVETARLHGKGVTLETLEQNSDSKSIRHKQNTLRSFVPSQYLTTFHHVFIYLYIGVIPKFIVLCQKKKKGMKKYKLFVCVFVGYLNYTRKGHDAFCITSFVFFYSLEIKNNRDYALCVCCLKTFLCCVSVSFECFIGVTFPLRSVSC